MALWPLFGKASGFGDIVRASAARKQKADLWLSYYHDRQTDDLLELIKRRWSRPEDFRLFSVNIVRKIVNKRSMVYKAAPVRTFDGWDQAAGEALYAAMGANVALKKANRLTKLLKTTVLQVRWGVTGPALALITPNILDVMADDPEAPSRVIVAHRPATTDGLVYREAAVTYSDWTADAFHRRDYMGRSIPVDGNPSNVNPYGVLPFVPLFDHSPDDLFFLPGGDDLIDAQRAVNVALVNLWRAIELQSHGQAWAAGIPAGDAIRTGPDRAVTLPENGKFGFAAPETPVAEVLKAIEFLVKQTAVSNDLAPNTFELEPKAESGAAKLAESRDLLEARQDDLDLWRVYEARLFEVIKRVVNTHVPGTIPEGATVSVDFGEVASSLSEVERLECAQRRIDLGIWSPVDALMADNPDIRDRAAALAELQRRRDEAATLGVGFTGPRFPSPSQVTQ